MCRFSVSEASLTDSPRRGGVTPSGQNVGHAFLRQHFAVPAPVSFDDLLLGKLDRERGKGNALGYACPPPPHTCPLKSEYKYNSAVASRVSDAFPPPLSISLFLSPFYRFPYRNKRMADADVTCVASRRSQSFTPSFFLSAPSEKWVTLTAGGNLHPMR